MSSAPGSSRLFWVSVAITAVTAGVGGVLIATVAQRQRVEPLAEARRHPAEAGQAVSPRQSRFSWQAQRRRRAVFGEVEGDGAFTRLDEPRPGDWLWSFREPGQTLDEYGATVVNRKSAARRTLHLLPLGELAPAHRALLPTLREVIAGTFDTPVTLLPAQPVDRRHWNAGRRQWNADRIVRDLAGRVPADSLGLFGLMSADLYGLDLNFVFGEALLAERAGVYSLHRFGSEPRALLRRALKLAVHEIGHSFGLAHCVFYECVMNGTNSLAETDRRPLHECPVCLAKLQWNLRFEPVSRYRKLEALYRRLGLETEARFVAARAAELSSRDAGARSGRDTATSPASGPAPATPSAGSAPRR